MDTRIGPACDLTRVLRLLAVVGAMTLSGCVNTPQMRESFSDTAVRFNGEVETTYNKTMFLNVVRSSMRTPMYFTSITELTRADLDKRTLAMVLPFGGGRNQALRTATGGLERSTAPLFKMSVQDGAAFHRGILSPLTLDEINNFRAIGFPDEYVWLLTIEAIEYTDGGSSPRTSNDPRNPKAFLDVITAIWANCKVESPPTQAETKDGTPGVVLFSAIPGRASCRPGKLITRSAEGVVYFVGQLLRDRTDAEFIANGRTYKVFAATCDTIDAAKRVRLSVQYEGKVCTVPAVVDGSSTVDLTMTTINFLNYVIGLHKESQQLRTVDAINISPR